MRVRDRPLLLTFRKSVPLQALAKELPTVHSVVGVENVKKWRRDGDWVLIRMNENLYFKI